MALTIMIFGETGIFLDGRAAIDYEAEHILGSLSLFCEKVGDLHKKVLADAYVAR